MNETFYPIACEPTKPYKTLQTEFYKGSRFRMSPNPSKLPVDKHRTLMVTPER